MYKENRRNNVLKMATIFVVLGAFGCGYQNDNDNGRKSASTAIEDLYEKFEKSADIMRSAAREISGYIKDNMENCERVMQLTIEYIDANGEVVKNAYSDMMDSLNAMEDKQKDRVRDTVSSVDDAFMEMWKLLMERKAIWEEDCYNRIREQLDRMNRQ